MNQDGKDPEKPHINSDSDSSWESLEDNVEDNPCVAAAKLLYIGSKHFNPNLALQCTDMKIPIEGAQTYFGVKQFKEYVPDIKVEGKPPPSFLPPKRLRPGRILIPPPPSAETAKSNVPGTSKDPTNMPSTSKASESTEVYYPIPGRRFLPHQLPIKVERKVHKDVENLLDTYKGPLGALNEARKNQRRVKIWTRDKYGIRGYCMGYVESFDRHWSLILRDVDEIFQRKRQIKDCDRKEDENLEDSIEDKKNFKSGILLTTYNKESNKRKRNPSSSTPTPKDKKLKPKLVKKGKQTGYLVEGPENAVEICRLGMEKLMIYDKVSGKSKSKTRKDKLKVADEVPPPVSNATKRKKQLVILKESIFDFVGNKITARSRNYEIVERHVDQLFLNGKFVAFIETNPNFD